MGTYPQIGTSSPTRWCCCGTARATGTRRPVHRLGGRRPHPTGGGGGASRRRAARRARPPARRAAHVGASAVQSARLRSRSTGRAAVDTRAAIVAAERAALRRAAGQGQGRRSRSSARSSSCSGAAPTTPRRRRCRRRRVLADRRPALRALPERWCREPSASKDVVERMLPYWYDDIVPDLRAGATVLVAAHGNSLRALVKHLDGISDDDIAGLNIPTGIPLLYRLDEDFRPLTGRRIPRPRRRGRLDRGGQEPGPLTRRRPPAQEQPSDGLGELARGAGR